MNITKSLCGKTVRLAHVRDNQLLIECTDGTEAVIEWRDDIPVLVQQNVKIIVPQPIAIGGIAGV